MRRRRERSSRGSPRPARPGPAGRPRSTTPCSRAKARIRAASSPPMNSGAPRCRCVGGGDRVPRRVVGAVGAVGADDVERGARAVGADRQHAGRGLHAVAAHEQRTCRRRGGRAARAARRRARRCRSLRRCAPSAPSLASATAVPPAEPAAVIRISSTSVPPWPSGIASTGRASTSTTCTPSAMTFTLRPPGRPVAALGDRGDQRVAVGVVEHPRRPDRRRAPVHACSPTRAAATPRPRRRGRRRG